MKKKIAITLLLLGASTLALGSYQILVSCAAFCRSRYDIWSTQYDACLDSCNWIRNHSED